MNYNPRSWIVWIAALAVMAMIARNPLYSIIILLLSLVAVRSYARQEAPLRSSFWRFSAAILIFSAIYHAMFIHVGDHVLLRLPPWPLVGGNITLEAIVDGIRNGLVLVALLGVFVALNSVITSRDLIRLVPASFQELGIVVMIAITYVPETRRQFHRIKEAQAIRGHRLKTIRDWRPLLLPLLVGGLERAMLLSEAMVARGLASAKNGPVEIRTRLLLLLGLILIFGGWLLALLLGWQGYILLGCGSIMILIYMLRKGRRSRRTSYVRERWRATDSFMILASTAAFLLFVVSWILSEVPAIGYSPYPRLSLPEFNPLIGASFFVISLPLITGFLFDNIATRSGKKKKEQTAYPGSGVRQPR